MKTPLVSAIMNCRNGEHFVRESIQSVLDQTMGDFELVFWDNMSTDSTAQIVKSFTDERIRYLLSDSDDPLGQARNRAFSAARGKWIAIIDSDDIWHPDFLEEQLAALDQTGASMIYSNATSFYPDGRERPYADRSETDLQTVDYEQLVLNYDVCISTVLFEHRVLEELEYVFDPELTVAEEKELFIRIAYRHHLVFNPSTLARYRMHATSDTWRRSEDFIRDAKKILINMEKAGMDAEFVRDKFLDSAYWTAAMAGWMRNDGAVTRRHLQSMRINRLRVPALFFLSYLPYRLVAPVLRLAGKRAF